jgi:hypothetical protein
MSNNVSFNIARREKLHTVVWHRQNRNLGDRSVAALDTAGALVDGRQIGVHVTWVSTSSRHFFSGGGNLTQRIAVGRQICENDQDMLFELVCVVLGGGEGKAGSDDTFDAVPCQLYSLVVRRFYSRRVVRQIQEQGDALHAAVLLKVSCEEATRFQIDTHCTKDDGEIVLVTVVYTLGRLSY